MQNSIESFAKIRKMAIEFNKQVSFIIENSFDIVKAIDKSDFHYLAGCYMIDINPEIKYDSIPDLLEKILDEIEVFDSSISNIQDQTGNKKEGAKYLFRLNKCVVKAYNIICDLILDI